MGAAASLPPVTTHSAATNSDKKPAAPANNAKQDERGTAKSPLVITIQAADEGKKEAQENAEYRERKANDAEIIRWTKRGVLVGVAQTLALILTFGIMGYMGVRQLRAYVSVEAPRLENLGPDLMPGGAVVIKNGGQTPAYKLRHYSSVRILPNPLPKVGKLVNPIAGDSMSEITLHTGATMDAPVGGEKTITQDQMKVLLHSDKVRIYLVGIVKYRDTFGFRRTTEFCYSVAQDALFRSAAAAYIDPEDDGEIACTLAPYHNHAT